MAALTDLGLSEYEARVYRTLLSVGPTTAKELSRASDVPMGRIYDVLNGLETADMVRTQNVSRPKKYAAVEPGTALDRLLDEKRRELESELDRYASVVDDLTEQLEAAEPRDEQFWTAAVGPDDTTDLLVERLAAATDSIVMVAAAPSPQFDLGVVGERVADELESALDRGVAVSVLVSSGLLEAVPDDLQRRYERTITNHSGFEVRVADDVSGTFDIIDRVEVCIGVPHPLAADEAFALIDLTDPEFAADVYEEFRPRWEAARPYPDALA